jgi:hypothetical protein
MGIAWTWIVSVLPLLLSVAFAADNGQRATPVPSHGIDGFAMESGSADSQRQTRTATGSPSVDDAASPRQTIQAVSDGIVPWRGRDMPAFLDMFTSRSSVYTDSNQAQSTTGGGHIASAEDAPAGQRGSQYGAAAVPASIIVIISGVLGFVLVARRRVSFIGRGVVTSKVPDG